MNSRSLQTTIIFLVIGGILALAFGGFFGPASRQFSSVLVQFQTWVSSRYLGVQDFFTAPRDIVSLRARNAELESQVSQLQAQVIELQQRVNETEILAALVDFSRSNPESTYKAAAVIGRDPSPFLHYIIINRGSNDDIRRGMPVVTNQGLVGRVDAVIADAARVQLITDPASAVNTYLQNADTTAVALGSVTGDVSLDMISQDAIVQPGDLILTSGLGGGYPADIPVGQVITLRSLEYELFQQATLQPAVDFTRLSIVLVITNFRPVDISPLEPLPSP
ncbi:MAG TPA: rod shape-determining protein MreC [Anaerolineales bacterium]|nr:rod shape-determining protein MreC [Anaerolineales bacterium]HMX74462.1 rod shape-determining protein MreC [Anaerolineales bacterium]HNB87167.1 rod shape-determining protein MreC [Anaerolineales bacterium]HNC89537.1 rod shape-determining protein MreC [Anaerolineales bacterium]HND92047.1 rod shape-determining protein MreC [Anaerolineales bacterium]